MIPKTLCDLLGFRDFDDCSLNLHLADSTIEKPVGRMNDVLIVANMNYVPIDFIVLDIDCNPSCLIILGRLFLCTIGTFYQGFPFIKYSNNRVKNNILMKMYYQLSMFL